MQTQTGDPATAGHAPFYTQLHGTPGLWLDAVLADADGELLFLSAWGRDTVVQEMLARLSLSEVEGGLTRLQVQGRGRPIEIGNPDRLDKHTGRVQTKLFGALTHLWVYQRLAVQPDRVNRKALLLHRSVDAADKEGRESLRERLWALVRETCHLPLLAHWRERVLDAFEEQDWVRPLEGLGMDAVLVDLGEPRVEDVIEHLAARGELALAQDAPALVPIVGAGAATATEADTPKEETPLLQQIDDPVFGPVIYSYTRAQAIEDGVLVDVSQAAREAGFRFPVALTTAVWDDCVAWTEEDSRRQAHQDESGRLWDVLWMAGCAVRAAKENAQELLFELYRVPRDGKSAEAVLTRLKLMAGPGNEGEPVLTILLPNED